MCTVYRHLQSHRVFEKGAGNGSRRGLGVVPVVSAYAGRLFLPTLLFILLQGLLGQSSPNGAHLESPELEWRTGGDGAWEVDETTSSFGGSSMRSGEGGRSTSSWIETVVEGPTNLVFYWKVSSNAFDHYLRFRVDGTGVDSISGGVDWRLKTYRVGEGLHTLRWEYTTNTSPVEGQNRAWLDQVSLGNVVPLTVNISGSGDVLVDPLKPAHEIGEQVGLTAIPSEGSLFQVWQSDLFTTSSQTSLTMDEAREVMARFGFSDTVLESPELVWRTGGDGAWEVDETTSSFGGSSMRSAEGGRSTSSWIETVVEGPTNLVFYWKVSSNQFDHYLRFRVDGTSVDSITGGVDWRLKTYRVGEGLHVLRWEYTTNTSPVEGQNRAWLDQVSLGNVVPLTVNISGEGDVLVDPLKPAYEIGEQVSLTAIPSEGSLFQVWQSDLFTTSSQTSLTMDEAREVTARFGFSDTVLESPELVWRTGGDGAWEVDETTSSFGGSSMRSAEAEGGRSTSSWIETVVAGPGDLEFHWKVSSNPFDHYLRFRVDGTSVDSITGGVDWSLKTYRVGEGLHTLRWEYTTNTSPVEGQNRAWLDQVRFEGQDVLPVISAQPQEAIVDEGASTTFQVQLLAGNNLVYRWLFNGATIPGETGSELRLNRVTPEQAGSYSVVISNGAGSVTSDAALLTVHPIVRIDPVEILRQPVGVEITEGESFRLTVGATGSDPIDYQWFKNDRAIPGATSPEFAVANAAGGDAGSYQVRVTNPTGNRVSSVVQVGVNPQEVDPEPGGADPVHPADLNGDFAISISEVTAYGTAWKLGEEWSLEPTDIPIAYVTRAGALWRGGETYRFDDSISGAPLWWVSVRDGLQRQSLETPVAPVEGSVVRILEKRGKTLRVRLQIEAEDPDAFVAIEERVSGKGNVTDVSGDGFWNPASRVLRFGPYPGDSLGELWYEIDSLNLESGIRWAGKASFDGVDIETGGVVGFRETNTSVEEATVRIGVDREGFQIQVREDVVVTIESTQSLVDSVWSPVGQVSGLSGSITWRDTDYLEHDSAFYRVVVE